MAAASPATAPRPRRARSPPARANSISAGPAPPPRPTPVGLPTYGQGGVCASRIARGGLEAVVANRRLDPPVAGAYGPLLVGLDTGDDAAVVGAPDGGPAFVLTTDFFTPVVDDAYD